MALVVQKYGSSSLAGRAMIGRVARRPPECELDMLLSSGERVSSALLAMAIHELGAPACSLSGQQAGMITTSTHRDARIVHVSPLRVRHELDRGSIVVVTGFQDFCWETRDVTTLGRGGSDTTAVALTLALEPDPCDICTDVDGVYTADPRVVPEARRLDHVTYDEMLEMASSGARVLVTASVEHARRHGLALHVRSSSRATLGTRVVGGSIEDTIGERPPGTGVAHDGRGGTVSLVGPDAGAQPDVARMFCDVLRAATTNFELAFRSDLLLTARCLPGESEAAVRALHQVFDLGRARVARAAAAGGVE